MPTQDDIEIQRILGDYRSGRLTLALVKTTEVIAFYERELDLQAKYCGTAAEIRRFQRCLYKLRAQVSRERNAAETNILPNTALLQHNTNEMAPFLVVPEAGPILKLKQRCSNPGGGLLENVAFNYDLVDGETTEYTNTVLFLRMPSGCVWKGNQGETKGGPRMLEAIDNDDGTNTHVIVTMSKSSLATEEHTVDDMLTMYGGQIDPRTRNDDVLVKEKPAILVGNRKRITAENQLAENTVR
jgi:hypothetical protein